MLTPNDFILNERIHLTLYGLLGDKLDFTGTVAGVTSHHGLPVHSNASINHTNIWPNIPTATQVQIKDDYRSYPYLILIGEDDLPVYIGIPWIEPSTFATVIDRTATIIITEFQDQTKTKVEELLRLNGYNVASVQISNV